MRCPECGTQGSGKFCSECGTALSRGAGFCADCGHKLANGALFCGECGRPVGARPQKPASAYLPWIISSVALILFIIALTYFVRGQAGPRAPGEPPTGGVIQGEGTPSGAAPSSVDLSSMTPRQAADRLFDRTMRESESGGERAAFFAEMGIQAYDAVPSDEIDPDARFHRGLLYLVMEDATAAGREADLMLGADPEHLLGLTLAARAADRQGDTVAAQLFRERLAAAYGTTDLSSREEYRIHEALIKADAVQAGASPD